jgi:hypothetical protein
MSLPFWRKLIFENGSADRRLYETAVLAALRDRLKRLEEAGAEPAQDAVALGRGDEDLRVRDIGDRLDDAERIAARRAASFQLVGKQRTADKSLANQLKGVSPYLAT